MLITEPDQINAAWVEAALRRSGALTQGGVEAIELEGAHGTWSRMTRIRVRYRDGSAGELPEWLRLKLCQDEFGPSELSYYSRYYAGLADAPIPPCYDSAYQEDPRRYHLLLKDLSETHTDCWKRTPDEEYARAMADAIGTLHAYRWGGERLRGIDLGLPDASDFARYMAHVGRGLEPLIELTKEQIDPSWGPRLRTIFGSLAERYTERARNPSGITLLHGDINPGNTLAPHHGTTPIYLIDHQPFDWSLTHWLGASDLVYTMVGWWETAQRRNLEEPMLRRYHATLRTRGVRGYSFEQLYDDYRLCIVETIGVAVEWCVNEEDWERMRWVWWPKLQRGIAAYEDLHCAEIWEAN
jgi:hypothetical protein